MPSTSRATPPKIFLLGSFQSDLHGKAARLPTRKAESLLAYLILHPEVQSRERLAALFWGDSPDELARRSLRTALSALRKELGEELLISDRETVQLNPDFPIWVDVQELEKQAAEVLSFDNSHAMINAELYRGDLLQDSYEEWVLEERDHYRDLFINALLRLAQSLRTNGEYRRAIEAAQKVISVDPTNEPAYQYLIFGYGALGERSAAIKSYQDCVFQLQEKLGVPPSEETNALYEYIKTSGKSSVGPAATKSNLPRPLTSFIGREQELTTLKGIFSKTRLLTLTGVGGCGKTRLSIELAEQLADPFQEGVWWVELASIQDERLVGQTVKRTLGIPDGQLSSAEESILKFLHGKRALLVLDNCEHVITACARLAESILMQCPQTRILATSREALSIQGEIAWLVPSLSLPPADQVRDLLEWECPRLFFERAASYRPDLRLTPENAPALLRICRALEGIPLAVELAASRVKILSLEQLASRLDDKLSLLTTGSRTAQPRQQTLRAAIDWSYDLLPEQEQVALRRLSVLAGNWTLDAAEAIAGLDKVAPDQTLDLITHLLDKSLLVADTFDPVVRYRMLEIIRQYAFEKLQEAQEVEQVRGQHLRYYSDLAQNVNPGWYGRDQAHLIKQFDAEYPNLRVALAHGLEASHHQEDLVLASKLACALGPFWNFIAEYNEGQMWLKKTIDRIDVVLTAPDLSSTERREFLSIKAKALYEYGFLVWFQGQYSKVESIFLVCSEIYQQLEDANGLAYSHIFLGHATWGFGDRNVARRMWSQALEQFYKSGDQWAAAMVHSFLGRAEREATNYDQAEYQYNRCVDLFRAVGDDWGLGIGLSHLGMLAFQRGDPHKARDLFEQRLVLAKRIGFKQSIAYSTFLLGAAAWKIGDADQVRRIMREALAYYYEMNSYIILTECLLGLAWVEAQSGRSEQAAYLLGAILQTDATNRLRSGFEDIYFHKPLIVQLQSQLPEEQYREELDRGRRSDVLSIAAELLKG